MKILVSIVLCVLSVAFLALGWYNMGLLFSLLAYGLLLYQTLKTVGINSVLFLFVVLFGLYGYSVPISVFFNADIGWHRVAKLRTWEMVDGTLFSFMLSNQLAFLAIALLYLPFVNRRIMAIPKPEQVSPRISYFRFALIAGILSSLSVLINFLRAGGFGAVGQGKAYYQGAINDLVLNIPYEGFFYISVALFALFFSTISTRSKYILFLPPYFCSILLVLMVNIMIGERGTLLVAMVIFALGYTINIRITRIKFKYIALLSILYFFFNILTLLRETSIHFDGFSSFFGTYKEKIYKLMNPANTEFGAPALNYRIFVDRKPDDYHYKWGKTYLELPWAFVPTYVYSNKPKSIIYEFRDDYFPERKEMGSTAGNGFSSLMEAYMNFWFFGPFLVYLVAIFFLIYVESKRSKKSMFIKLLYLLLFNIVLIFSRSASQYIFFNLLLYIFQISFVVLVYKIVPKRVFEFLPDSNENM